MMGAGILPGPFARADEQGLDDVLAALERAEARVGRGASRRRRSSGASSPRAGSARRAARASSPTRSPTRASRARRCCSRRAATSASSGSTARRPTRSRRRSSASSRSCGRRSRARSARWSFASSNIFTFSAGADIKEFTKMEPEKEGRELVESGHGFMRGMEQSRVGHDRGGQLARVRRRLRAGDGVRLPHRRRVGHLRPARDQPRDHPRLRRHPAAAAAGRGGQGARDEPGRRPDRRLRGATARAGQPGRAGPRAVRHRAAVGAQARAARRRSRSSRSRRSRRRATSTRASRPRARASPTAFGSEDAKEGIGGIPRQAPAEVRGEVARSSPSCSRDAESAPSS